MKVVNPKELDLPPAQYRQISGPRRWETPIHWLNLLVTLVVFGGSMLLSKGLYALIHPPIYVAVGWLLSLVGLK